MAAEPPRTKHWSDMLPVEISSEEWSRVQKELADALQATERVEGIVHLCSLDMLLEQLLRCVMIDSKSVDDLMRDGQALQSFSPKLRLAYALGLVPGTVRKDLDYLNKMRNEFAHNADIKSFDEAPICDWCVNLSTTKQSDGTSLLPRLAYRAAVIESVRFLLQEFRRRLTEKLSHQGQQTDSVESRYAVYLDARSRSAK